MPPKADWEKCKDVFCRADDWLTHPCVDDKPVDENEKDEKIVGKDDNDDHVPLRPRWLTFILFWGW
jgi:hypothetical protein